VFCARVNKLFCAVALTVGAIVFYACVHADFPRVPGNVYGELLSSNEHQIKNSVVEEIALYPKKMARSRQRIMRKANLVKRNKAKGVVLISHGFMCSKEDVGFLRALFPHCHCMTFDMRAHGEHKEGQYCTLGRDEALDVAAAALYLRSRDDLKGLPLLVYGFSMGAVAAIEAQAKDSDLFDGMILDCPFESSENVIKKGLDNMKISLFGYQVSIPGRSLMEKYIFHPYVQSFVKAMLKAFAQLDSKDIRAFVYPVTPVKSVAKIEVPLYLIGCKNDKKIPIESIKRIYANAASGYKKLWISNGRQHYDSYFYNPELYARRVGKFARRLCTGKLKGVKKEKITIDQDLSSVAVHIDVDQVKKVNEKEKK